MNLSNILESRVSVTCTSQNFPGQTVYVLGNLLDNCFLVSDGMLLLALIGALHDWNLYEIITQCGEYILSAYSECYGK